MITNSSSNTTIDEIGRGIYRIATPVTSPDGFAFSFNQYLVADDEPLLFHTGLRGLFPLVREAIETVLPASSLRWIAFSHVEADECGALNDFLAIAPNAAPLCSRVAALVSVGDLANRPPRALADGETMSIGSRTIRWFDTPHMPHGWESGYLLDETTSTLFCGDLFTQGGASHPPLTSSDILDPSEAFRRGGVDAGIYDYFSNPSGTRPLFAKLAASRPSTLACMHGSAWQGDGAGLLMELAERVGA